MGDPDTMSIILNGPEATDRLGRELAARLGAGDVILLEGSVGAGKTHLARAIIQAGLARHGLAEEVPSPTFTLVQTYDTGSDVIVHADLYRLSSPGEVGELGLADAFGTAITLVEWPDRLGPDKPKGALTVRLGSTADGEARTATFGPMPSDWSRRLSSLWPGYQAADA